MTLKTYNNIKNNYNGLFAKELKCSKEEFNKIKVTDTIGYDCGIYATVIKKDYYPNYDGGRGILWLLLKEMEN